MQLKVENPNFPLYDPNTQSKESMLPNSIFITDIKFKSVRTFSPIFIDGKYFLYFSFFLKYSFYFAEKPRDVLVLWQRIKTMVFKKHKLIFMNGNRKVFFKRNIYIYIYTFQIILNYLKLFLHKCDFVFWKQKYRKTQHLKMVIIEFHIKQ